MKLHAFGVTRPGVCASDPVRPRPPRGATSRPLQAASTDTFAQGFRLSVFPSLRYWAGEARVASPSLPAADERQYAAFSTPLGPLSPGQPGDLIPTAPHGVCESKS